jgi:hypothetical protein
MISPPQRDALRTFVLAALAIDDTGVELDPLDPALPLVDEDAVRWAPDDGPRSPDGPRVVLDLVGAIERAPTEDSDSQVDDGGLVLETRYRDLLNVTIAIRCYSRRSSTDPSFDQDADQILRRIWSRVHSRSLSLPLQAAGLATTTRGAISSLPRLARGVQWETGASFDLGLRATSIVTERPGWVERAGGQATYTPPPPATPETFDADATP